MLGLATLPVGLVGTLNALQNFVLLVEVFHDAIEGNIKERLVLISDLKSRNMVSESQMCERRLERRFKRWNAFIVHLRHYLTKLERNVLLLTHKRGRSDGLDGEKLGSGRNRDHRGDFRGSSVHSELASQRGGRSAFLGSDL